MKKKYVNICIVVVVLVVLCILLVGLFGNKGVKCSSSSEQKNYTISTDYMIKAKKKIVTSVTIKQVIESKDKKVLENFKKQLEDQYKSNNNSYGGYKYKVVLSGKKLTADITIDYTKFDLDKFVKANGAMKEYVNKDNKLTIDGAKKMYKSTGAKCSK